MSNLISITEKRGEIDNHHKQEVVDRLKQILAMAERGEIVGFAYAGECFNRDILTGFTSGIGFALAGALEATKSRMIDELNEDDE